MGFITHARRLVQNKFNPILHKLLKTRLTWGGGHPNSLAFNCRSIKFGRQQQTGIVSSHLS